MVPTGKALEVRDLRKAYASVLAVDGLSFDVEYGEVFGLLGPNGAGKTTTIRMILDIIKPNSGEIAVLGGPMSEEKKARIGYLPEERGLYPDMTLMETLLYLGQLKGLSRSEAQRRVETVLRRVELWDVRGQKIQSLSRGMTQKAQFVAATLHEPQLIIIDEPFSGLDPINTRMIKELLDHLRERGAAIIMSTHQMHQVEEMCERILLIDHGRRVLYGRLAEVRQQFASNAVEVALQGEIGTLRGVEQVSPRNGSYRLVLQEGARPEQVLKELVNRPDVIVERFEQVQMSLDEIFIRVVGQREEEPA